MTTPTNEEIELNQAIWASLTTTQPTYPVTRIISPQPVMLPQPRIIPNPVSPVILPRPVTSPIVVTRPNTIVTSPIVVTRPNPITSPIVVTRPNTIVTSPIVSNTPIVITRPNTIVTSPIVTNSPIVITRPNTIVTSPIVVTRPNTIVTSPIVSNTPIVVTRPNTIVTSPIVVTRPNTIVTSPIVVTRPNTIVTSTPSPVIISRIPNIPPLRGIQTNIEPLPRVTVPPVRLQPQMAPQLQPAPQVLTRPTVPPLDRGMRPMTVFNPPIEINHDEQMRQAIIESLRTTQPNLYQQYVEDTEDAMLQEAINDSIIAAEKIRLANIPVAQLSETRRLRELQDKEYEETLRRDQERVLVLQKEAEEATNAVIAAEKAALLIHQTKMREEQKLAALNPPILEYPLETSDIRDIYMLRFRLPSGVVVNHSFNRNEPLRSVLEQLRFDLKYIGDLVLTIQPRTLITCDSNTSIDSCGFANKIAIMVTYP